MHGRARFVRGKNLVAGARARRQKGLHRRRRGRGGLQHLNAGVERRHEISTRTQEAEEAGQPDTPGPHPQHTSRRRRPPTCLWSQRQSTAPAAAVSQPARQRAMSISRPSAQPGAFNATVAGSLFPSPATLPAPPPSPTCPHSRLDQPIRPPRPLGTCLLEKHFQAPGNTCISAPRKACEHTKKPTLILPWSRPTSCISILFLNRTRTRLPSTP